MEDNGIFYRTSAKGALPAVKQLGRALLFCFGRNADGYFKEDQETENTDRGNLTGCLLRCQKRRGSGRGEDVVSMDSKGTKKIPTASMYDLTYKTYLLEAMRGDFDVYASIWKSTVSQRKEADLL